MATTDATRRADSTSGPTAAPRAPEQIESAIVTSPVQVGIEWGYPISFIRRLGIAFAVLLFAGFAHRRGVDCRTEPLFDSKDFGDTGHEPEIRFRIGPLGP